VTFRQEDSIAIPNRNNRPSNASSTPAYPTHDEQMHFQPAETPLSYGKGAARVNHHQRPVGSTPQGILMNNNAPAQNPIESKRISVPSTGLPEPTADHATALVGVRQMSQTMHRPSTAGPAPDTRNGILV